MESLSSFIGIDGTNTTLNSGRILINLKPLDERKINATDVIRRLAAATGRGRRHHALHAAGAGSDGGRPRQPHAVPVHAGRSQRRRAEHLRAADAGPPARAAANCATSPATSRCRACAPAWSTTATLPRAWASRLPLSTTLYDAYGQRQVSTIFTQLNQYHVVLEVKPEFQQNPVRSAQSLTSVPPAGSSLRRGVVSAARRHRRSAVQRVRSQRGAAPALRRPSSRRTLAALSSRILHGVPTGGQVPLSAFTHVEHSTVPITVNHQGQFPVVTLSFNLAPDASLGDAVQAVNKVKDEIDMPASIQAEFQGTAAGVSGIAGQRAGADSGRAGHRLHRAGRAV